MTDEKLITRFCVGCNKKHEEIDWRWHSKMVGKKKVWWCGKCIDCTGCKKIHFNDTGRTLIRGSGENRIELCGRWYSSSPASIEKRMRDMSPEQVLSGVQYGLPQTIQGESKDYSQERKEQSKALKDAL